MNQTQLNEPDPMFDDTTTTCPAILPRRDLEKVIVLERLELYNSMKPCGASALRRHLHSLGVQHLPSASTIGRMLTRQCLTNGRTGYYPEDYR